MHRKRRSILCRFLKQLGVVQNDVRPDDLLDHIQKRHMQKPIQPIARIAMHIVGVQDDVVGGFQPLCFCPPPRGINLVIACHQLLDNAVIGLFQRL